MNQAGFVLRLLLVITVLLSTLDHSYSAVAAEEGAELVRLMVELKDVDGDIETRRELRQAIHEVRRISSRAPGGYVVDGEQRRAEDLRRWRVVEVGADEAQTLFEELLESPAVASVHYEKIYEAAFLPDDPRFVEQYGLLSNEWPLADINAPAAWDKTTGSGSTVIAILDGGVDLTHEDLSSKTWANSGEVPGNGVDDDGNGFIDDVHGWDFVVREGQPAGLVAHKHATHVAGIAAAAGNNGVGIAGVDWGARIMSVRVLSGSGFGREEGIIRGIDYAIANGADIINLSIVGTRSAALAEAVENAFAAGVVVVAAAGNSGADTGRLQPYPVCAESDGVNMVLGVAATDDEGEPARFSNYGDCVDITAPGDDIVSTVAGGGYREMTGTSMSAPFAAGVVGLYLALHPGAGPAEVIAAVSDGDSFAGEDADEWNADYKGQLNAARVVGGPSTSSGSDGGGPSTQPSSETSPSAKATEDPLSPQASEGQGKSAGSGSDGGPSTGSGSDGPGDVGPDPPTPEALAGKSSGLSGRVAAARVNHALIPKINAAFRSVFGRNPGRDEHAYWLLRVQRGEKNTFGALTGAMAWHKLQGRTYVPWVSASVAGAVGGNVVTRINAVHRTAFGRNPALSEHSYWLGRVVRGEKTSETALLGAMIFHRLAGIQH